MSKPCVQAIQFVGRHVIGEGHDFFATDEGKDISIISQREGKVIDMTRDFLPEHLQGVYGEEPGPEMRFTIIVVATPVS